LKFKFNANEIPNLEKFQMRIHIQNPNACYRVDNYPEMTRKYLVENTFEFDTRKLNNSQNTSWEQTGKCFAIFVADVNKTWTSGKLFVKKI